MDSKTEDKTDKTLTTRPDRIYEAKAIPPIPDMMRRTL